MSHPVENATAELLGALRAASLDIRVECDSHIVPGLYFSWDSDESDVQLDLSSEPGGLFTVTGQVRKTPDWLTLNIELGAARFVAGDVLGVVTQADISRTDSPDMPELTGFVRTFHRNLFADTELADSLIVANRGPVQTALHPAEGHETLTTDAAFHTLIIRLPQDDFRLDITDMRIVVLPAGVASSSPEMTLASLQ